MVRLRLELERSIVDRRTGRPRPLADLIEAAPFGILREAGPEPHRFVDRSRFAVEDPRALVPHFEAALSAAAAALEPYEAIVVAGPEGRLLVEATLDRDARQAIQAALGPSPSSVPDLEDSTVFGFPLRASTAEDVERVVVALKRDRGR